MHAFLLHPLFALCLVEVVAVEVSVPHGALLQSSCVLDLLSAGKIHALSQTLV